MKSSNIDRRLRRMNLLRRLLILLSVTTATAASAEPLGQITAFLEGEEMVWHTITFPQGGVETATATWSQKPHLAELLVQGHPVPQFTSKNVLSIEVRFTGQYQPEDTPASVEILYTPNGLSGPLWTSRGAPKAPTIQFIAHDIWGRFGNLLAVFSGQICERPRLFSPTDSGTCKRINGTLDTRLVVD